MERPATPPTQFQHRDELIGYRSSYIPKPESRAGPQSYDVRCSFDRTPPPSIEIRRCIHLLYGRDFCRAQRKCKDEHVVALSPPPPQPSPHPAAQRKHVRSHSLTTLIPPGEALASPPGHMRSRSFSISDLNVSKLLLPEPEPEVKHKSKTSTKWKKLGEHLWHEKSKMLLNALLFTPPRHPYIERRNEVQNPLFHDHQCNSCQSSAVSNTTKTNFDSFIAGYFRNTSTQGSVHSQAKSPDTKTTQSKWAKWRQYPSDKRPQWTSNSPSRIDRKAAKRSSSTVTYSDFLAKTNSYTRRASLKARLHV
ncbi:unnamed protein product [Aphanomyces euteiches]|uniref:Uncharacterized protein n=1 Tax=Aphanomyces euteiches TaxID=100861 RepID=A0A6G0X0I7_9STRA|nr:hypothetical protein Ae201684_009637 [Aphanomyces euteiches]KAH9157881.1 hypothetical protein AeRB84_000353 [Aphanomyces euteiches]